MRSIFALRWNLHPLPISKSFVSGLIGCHILKLPLSTPFAGAIAKQLEQSAKSFRFGLQLRLSETMDGLSAASGIVGIIGFTFQLVNVVVQYGMDWKTAPSDVKSFMTELQALKIVISETHANILANPEFEAAFEGRTSAVLSRLGSNAPSVTETKSLLETCHGELQDFVAYLCKKGGGRRFGWWRFTWFFRTRRVRNTVTKLHRICQTFNSMVSIDAATLGATTYREVTAARLEQTEWYRTKNNQGILAWLSHLSFEEEQRENFSKCHTGTGEWFLSSKEFLEWRDSDEFKNSTLCCYGKRKSASSHLVP